MEPVKVYLSHGGGVNSWALYLWLIEQGQLPGKDFEAVFVHHGCDAPETYRYLLDMEFRGYPVTTIFPDAAGHWNLYEYSKHFKIFPTMHRRWCTVKFKIEPFQSYQDKPCVVMLGYDAGEARRANKKQMHEKEGVTYGLSVAGRRHRSSRVYRFDQASRIAGTTQKRMLYMPLPKPQDVYRSPERKAGTVLQSQNLRGAY